MKLTLASFYRDCSLLLLPLNSWFFLRKKEPSTNNFFVMLKLIGLFQKKTKQGGGGQGGCFKASPLETPQNCVHLLRNVKGTRFSHLRQFLSTESPLKMMKNAFIIFLIELFFSTWPTSQDKREQKELLRWNKKHFSSFLKGYHWSK